MVNELKLVIFESDGSVENFAFLADSAGLRRLRIIDFFDDDSECFMALSGGHSENNEKLQK